MADADCTPPTTTCTKCGETKPLTSFRSCKSKKGKVYYRHVCRWCEVQASLPPVITIHKICTKCGLTKPLNAFGIRSKLRGNPRPKSRCKACQSAASMVYRATHEVQVSLSRKAYRESHREALRLHAKSYREAHLEERRLFDRMNNTYQRYPERKNATSRRHLWRKKHAVLSDLTIQDWHDILAAFDHRCAYCGRKMQRLTQDHITPLSKGGNHTKSNVVPACRSCNSKKHVGPPLTPVQPLLL